jgi:hypothetical protein
MTAPESLHPRRKEISSVVARQTIRYAEANLHHFLALALHLLSFFVVTNTASW